MCSRGCCCGDCEEFEIGLSGDDADFLDNGNKRSASSSL